ncbi:hypothetical protein DFH11DRAFT_1547996 [Phellopilus nigrolimitatus]|nr:hypothetical protein DFH11DRAFT_1547996 [Phellopilus nigrolimitatus]
MTSINIDPLVASLADVHRLASTAPAKPDLLGGADSADFDTPRAYLPSASRARARRCPACGHDRCKRRRHAARFHLGRLARPDSLRRAQSREDDFSGTASSAAGAESLGERAPNGGAETLHLTSTAKPAISDTP